MFSRVFLSHFISNQVYIKHLCTLILLGCTSQLLGHNPSDYISINEEESGTIQFIPNEGQWDAKVAYKVPMNNGSLFLEKDKLTFLWYDGDDLNTVYDYRHGGKNETFLLKSHVWQMDFIGAQNPQISAEQAFEHYYNYFSGKNSDQWASNVTPYQKLHYKDLYPGIDLQMRQGKSGHFKYQFEIAPGADHKEIAIAYSGVDSIWLENEELHYSTSVNKITETHLKAWQIIDGKKVEVSFHFELTDGKVTFETTENIDPNAPLVIDPDIIFSSYTGSLADNFGFTATYDNNRNFYAGGIARADGYPTTIGAIQDTFAGGITVGNFIRGFNADLSISKFNSDGTQLLYSTYLGGSLNDQPHSLIVNNNNELYIFGRSNSNDFPVTSAAYDTSHNGLLDIIVSRINADGTQLLASTYIGGDSLDGVNISPAPFNYGSNFNLKYNYADDSRGEILLDNQGFVYVAAATQSPNFPLISPSTNALRDTFSGNQDGCIIQLSPDLENLIWSTNIGGSGNDALYSMAFDTSNNLYLCGGTNSIDFKISQTGYDTSFNGLVDGFIFKINAQKDSIINSTFYGTTEYDQTFFIELDADENVYVLGQTEGFIQATSNTYNNPNSGIFVSSFTKNLDTLRFQTTIGDGTSTPLISPTAFLVDDVCKSIYLCGWGGANLGRGSVAGLPVTPDAFVGTSDGDDFYLMVLSEDAERLEYATFMGGQTGSRGEHVDGGTSRFDKSGIVYQAVCAGCGGSSAFPTTPGVVSNTNNSTNCNLAAFKFNINFLESTVNINTQDGCIPLYIELEVINPNADFISWDLGNGLTIRDSSNISFTYDQPGNYDIVLVTLDSTSCGNTTFIDTVITEVLAIDDSVFAEFSIDTTSTCDSLVAIFNDSSTLVNRYFWDFGDGETSSIANPTHTYDQPGIYNITLITSNENTCNIVDSANVTLEYLPFVNAEVFISDTFSCLPAEIQLYNLSGPIDSTQWIFSNGFTSNDDTLNFNFNTPDTIDVMLIGIDSSTCNITDTSSAQITLIDDSIFAAFDTILTAALCDSLVLDFENNSLNATSYQWLFSDSTYSTLFEPTKVFSDTGIHEIRLVAYNENTCNANDTAFANAYSKMPVLAGFSTESDCYPFSPNVENASFNATAYEWYLNGTFLSNDSIPVFSLEEEGNNSLLLVAENPNTCNVTDSIVQPVSAYGYPTAFFETDSSAYPIFRPIQFNNQSEGALLYSWEFGDGAVSDEVNPTHFYENAALYEPCLTATNEYDCKDVYCKEIEATFRGVVDVPNAFSPNNDGSNDILYVKGFGVEYLEFKVYNRWGELVFESNSLENGWDGIYKGRAQEQEVYTYTLEAWFENGTKTDLRKGNVTLLR